jgi:hypothetical protein
MGRLIVIPMAGDSSRFQAAGVILPKWTLDLKGHPMLEWAIASLGEIITKDTKFMFVTKNNNDHKASLQSILNNFNLDYEIVNLETNTRGQAETVAKAISNQNKLLELVIWNVDTFVNPIALKKIRSKINQLVVSKLSGDHWSFAKINDAGFVVETEEKKRISDNASVGLYLFSSIGTYLSNFALYLQEIEVNKKLKSELFVAPIYNYLIQKNVKVEIFEVNSNDVFCMGTPTEYDFQINNNELAWPLVDFFNPNNPNPKKGSPNHVNID